MRKFFSLLKLQINAKYGLSYMRYNAKNDKKALLKGIGIGAIVLIAIAEVVGLYTYLMYLLFNAASSINTPQIVLTMASVASGVIILIFGIFYIMGQLFLSKDAWFLSSLPITQGSVFMSKFILVLLGEYPFAFFLMLPPVIIYGVGTQRGVVYYLTAIFCTLLLPLVPLVISAVLSLLLMNIVGRSSRRDLITIVGSIIIMIGFIGGQNYLVSRIPEDNEQFAMALLQSSNAIIEFMGRAFPPSVWITKALSAGGVQSVLNLLYLLIASLGAFLLVYFIASLIYQRGATAQLETRPVSGKAKLTYGSSSKIMAIFKNEWRILLRTPIYALNSLVVVVMAPLMMMMPMLGGNFSKDSDLKFLYDIINSGDAQEELLLIMAGIITFFALLNPAISTTFSREGKNFWILKHIPMEVKDQVYGKLLAGYSISFLASSLAAIMAMFSFRLGIALTIMIIILSALALVPISVLNIYIDFKRPKLTWNNPQEAIKQNFNVFLGMMGGILLITAFALVAYGTIKLGLNVYAIFGIMAFLLLMVIYLSVALMKKAVEKGYHNIEV